MGQPGHLPNRSEVPDKKGARRGSTKPPPPPTTNPPNDSKPPLTPRGRVLGGSNPRGTGSGSDGWALHAMALHPQVERREAELQEKIQETADLERRTMQLEDQVCSSATACLRGGGGGGGDGGQGSS